MDRQYGGFWRRLYAFTIDKVILGFLGMILLILGSTAFGLGISAYDMAADPEALMALGGRVFLLYQAVTLFLDMAYFTYFHGTTGQTPGKRLMGLRVVEETGGPIGLRAGRSVLGRPSCAGWATSSRPCPCSWAFSGRARTGASRPGTTRSPAPSSSISTRSSRWRSRQKMP